MKKLIEKNVERKIGVLLLNVTESDVQLEHFFVLSVATSQQVRRLISTFTLQNAIAYAS